VLGSSPFPPYLKSRIAQALLKMGKNVARNFAGSLTQLPTQFIIQLAGNQAGSHVVEAALKCQTIPSSMQDKLVAKLTGSFASLARSSQGSHVVELCYARGDTKMKEAIAQELSDNEQALANDRYGRFVLRTCKVALFREKKDAWRSHVSSAETTRALFRELLDDGDNASEGKPTTDSAPAAAATEEDDAEAYPGGQDAFVSLLGMTEEAKQRVLAQVAGGKKQKRKKPKKAAKKESSEEAPVAAAAAEDDSGKKEADEEDEALKKSVMDALKKASGKQSDKDKKKKQKKLKKRPREEEEEEEQEKPTKKARQDDDDDDDD